MHYEQLQTADTSFKTHEQLQMFKQPDSRLFLRATFITHSGRNPKDIEEHLTRT